VYSLIKSEGQLVLRELVSISAQILIVDSLYVFMCNALCSTRTNYPSEEDKNRIRQKYSKSSKLFI